MHGGCRPLRLPARLLLYLCCGNKHDGQHRSMRRRPAPALCAAAVRPLDCGLSTQVQSALQLLLLQQGTSTTQGGPAGLRAGAMQAGPPELLGPSRQANNDRKQSRKFPGPACRQSMDALAVAACMVQQLGVLAACRHLPKVAGVSTQARREKEEDTGIADTTLDESTMKWGGDEGGCGRASTGRGWCWRRQRRRRSEDGGTRLITAGCDFVNSSCLGAAACTPEAQAAGRLRAAWASSLA